MTVDLKELNGFLADKSYIDGYTPSQADVAVFEALPATISKVEYPHVARFQKHIAAIPNRSALPGQKKPADSYLPKKQAAEEDDDIDLFGSDEEEDAEAERIKAERVAAYNAKKAASKSHPSPSPHTRTTPHK
jgi:elongation factor 1-beta